MTSLRLRKVGWRSSGSDGEETKERGRVSERPFIDDVICECSHIYAIKSWPIAGRKCPTREEHFIPSLLELKKLDNKNYMSEKF